MGIFKDPKTRKLYIYNTFLSRRVTPRRLLFYCRKNMSAVASSSSSAAAPSNWSSAVDVSASPYDAALIAALRAQHPSWQQTMLRVKDPQASVAFYQENFGMTLCDELHFGEGKGDFSLYFLTTVKSGDPAPPAPGTKEAAEYVWNARNGQAFLELTWNHGTEKEDAPKTQIDHAGRAQVYHNGNSAPRGFGHIAFNTLDVYAASTKLEAAGVPFKKRPDEGRMKGLAFCLDPDGYWVELVRRSEGANASYTNEYNLSQTMIRVDDPVKTVTFYRDLWGMEILSGRDFSDFSLFFMGTGNVDDSKNTHEKFDPCLELTWNHGTEKEEAPSYHDGNATTWKGEPAPRGFGHIGFLVDDLNATCDLLEAAGVTFIKKPNEGSMKTLAFVKDPSGWWIEVIQRNFKRS